MDLTRGPHASVPWAERGLEADFGIAMLGGVATCAGLGHCLALCSALAWAERRGAGPDSAQWPGERFSKDF